MKDVQETCRIAVIQAEPVMFDKAGGLKKALRCIRNAAAEEAELIVFPELFIPGYPIGMNFGFSMGKRTEAGRADWKRYYDASLIAGGEEFKQLSDAAKDAKAYVSMGFSERDAINGTLYNSNVIFSPDGSWSVHRKLKPTGSERLVWGDANRDYFPVVETPWGPIGSMICWESYMPLARVALYQKGINCDMVVRKSSYPTDLQTIDDIKDQPDMVCRGGSCIIDPYGHAMMSPVWDEETILYADIDMTLPAACKMEHDAVGHYSRPDVLELVVHE